MPDHPIEVETAAPVTAAVIWLHGLGADGHDFEPIVPELNLPPDLGVRFIFPHAPVQPVTINAGYAMRAWYDIIALGADARQDEAGIRASEKIVCELIEHEVARGIVPERIVLAGFSQGGAMALHTALRYPSRLAGIIALSTYLPLHELAEAERHGANRELPIFMAHGSEDNVVPLQLGELSRAELERLGHPIDWHLYRMGHTVLPQEIGAIGTWLAQRLRAPLASTL